ncbi:metallophosphoesterase family protein [Staphylococcus auricularis]|uniref:Metallophosphoesterase n=1 Tax=Staphylococcus auricularis TaxID=29379 RepID=A0AAW7MDP8_9STAP|nr:metallophosphoesterase [Staphylococcus auricularis]MDC6327203.1 metallophosphoesterase [Staphylococcus auricularis]MDN4533087.1 metallophosphoesterase [Staphylococcus auricularis]MDN4533411.1 metallophosphoesterase [Staphylococcus auricularis]
MTKFTIFTDLHSEIIDNSEKRIHEILQEATKQQAQVLINLGDFGYFAPTDDTKCISNNQPINYHLFYEEQTDKYLKKTEKLLDLISYLHIPTLHVLGNHDMDFNSKAEAIRYYGIPNNYYYKDIDEFRFIVLDTNFYLNNKGEEVDYDRGNYFNEKRQALLSQEQVEWLKEDALITERAIILLSHNPLKDEKRGIQNAKYVQSILNLTNKKLLCLSGHKHIDKCEKVENIIFIEVNSASYHWLGEKQDSAKDYSREKIHDYPLLPYIIRYPVALYATIEWIANRVSIWGRQPENLPIGEKERALNITSSILDREIDF